MSDLKKAIYEQEAANRISSTLDRVNHFKMLEKKFGPRVAMQRMFYTNDDVDGSERYITEED